MLIILNIPLLGISNYIKAEDETINLSTYSNDGFDNRINITLENINEFSNVKYIDNSKYFIANPLHKENDGSDNAAGTCTTVAAQLILGYHNYYSDRRLR